jgi:hypothetical protein
MKYDVQFRLLEVATLSGLAGLKESTALTFVKSEKAIDKADLVMKERFEAVPQAEQLTPRRR